MPLSPSSREHPDKDSEAGIAGQDPVGDAAVARDDAAGPDLPNIPLLDDIIARPEDSKPTWRGWIHAGTFPLTIVGGIVLVSLAQGAPAKWSTAVFALSSLLLFGVSALYHRLNWSPRSKVLLKRMDHANIFLLIAGSYTPVAVLALPPEKGSLLLILVWGGAFVGIIFRMFWLHAPRWLYVFLYIAMGWAAVMYLFDIFRVNPATMTLIIVGGLFYTGGAVVYALKRPNPFPGHFGFHEIFHVCTVLAFLCHWTGILLLAIDPAYNLG
ncbi:PAQR family membrane homeostasis protein TrhA [Mycetocola miduiensis]